MSDQNIPTLEILRQQRDEILNLAAKYGADNVRIFGSVARGEAKAQSDVDFIVRFKKGTSLFEVSAFWQELQQLVGYSVNVISEAGLRERFQQRIQQDVVKL